MKILLVNQIQSQSDKGIKYKFEEDIIYVRMYKGGKHWDETFDFTGLPDGELPIEIDVKGNDVMKHSLPILPILEAVKENGELRVKLLGYIPDNATEEEKFPQWMDHTEYNDYIERIKRERREVSNTSKVRRESKNETIKNDPLEGL